MAEGRLTGVSWRERSSEPTPMVSPAGAKAAAKTMTEHAALGPAPSLRVGDARLPVLGACPYVCVRHHAVRDDPCGPRGHLRLG